MQALLSLSLSLSYWYYFMRMRKRVKRHIAHVDVGYL